MAEIIHILRPISEEENLETSEALLRPCPVCGAKAYIHRAAPDGFFMGYSAGCPRFCIGDGIHGIETFEGAEAYGYAVHHCFTKEEAIAAWNRRATYGNDLVHN